MRRLFLALTVLAIACTRSEVSTPAPLDAADATPPRGASEAAATADAATEAAAPPSRFASCEDAPLSMVCIPGGASVFGSDDHQPNERPRRSIEVSTFYIDKHEVTNGDYARCEKSGDCPSQPKGYIGFTDERQPAVPMTWLHANAYCLFAGKRLPSEAEWEKVARGGAEGRTYPWGEEAPTCEKAHYNGCQPPRTKPVGSLPAGAYGVFDMAGNGYEWVQDWASECVEGCRDACGASCKGLDPLGPCGGGPTCPGRATRVLKGGSWYWPGDDMRGARRRPEVPGSGMHRLSFRCASTLPTLSTLPPLLLTDPIPDPGDPSPPSEEQVRKLSSVPDDTDVLQLKLCKEAGATSVDCRDANNYVTSNEEHQHVWVPYIENLGGGYVGVGSDQSYAFIALAKSRWAWIFDYDPAVVRLHYIVRALLLNAPTPDAFRTAFAKVNAETTRAWIRDSLVAQPEEQAPTLLLFQRWGAVLEKHFVWVATEAPIDKEHRFGWLRSAEHYRFLRLLFQQKRISIRKGNLLTDKVMPSIAAAARSLGAPIRVYYSSNAEEMWPKLSPRYRENVALLPFDLRSVALRTVSGPRFSPKAQMPWHYVVHAALDLQRKVTIDGYDHIWSMMEARRKTDVEFMSTIGLPAKTPREPRQ